jgi:hypothetical protein
VTTTKRKAKRKVGRPRVHPVGKPYRSRAARRGTSKKDAAAKLARGLEMDREYDALETQNERIWWLARHGVEADDISLKLGLGKRLATDAGFKERFDALVNQGLADMRIEIAKTILSEARLGQVTALKEMAQAHLAAFKEQTPSTEFATGYRAKVEELLEKLRDAQHAHVLKKFRFEE